MTVMLTKAGDGDDQTKRHGGVGGLSLMLYFDALLCFALLTFKVIFSSYNILIDIKIL